LGLLPTWWRFIGCSAGYLKRAACAATFSSEETDAYVALMKRGGGGNVFLKIMRGFELTPAKQNFFHDGPGSQPYPAQVVWRQRDRMLADGRRRAVQEALMVDSAVSLAGHHFLQVRFRVVALSRIQRVRR
jgi:hypothetical protein